MADPIASPEARYNVFIRRKLSYPTVRRDYLAGYLPLLLLHPCARMGGLAGLRIARRDDDQAVLVIGDIAAPSVEGMAPASGNDLRYVTSRLSSASASA